MSANSGVVSRSFDRSSGDLSAEIREKEQAIACAIGTRTLAYVYELG